MCYSTQRMYSFLIHKSRYLHMCKSVKSAEDRKKVESVLETGQKEKTG